MLKAIIDGHLTPAKKKELRHDLKNHLSVIIAFAQLLHRELPNLPHEKAIELIQKIEERAQKIVKEIDVNLADEVSSE
jgi:nitrogen-specific signal transduction histidine kinase